MKITTIEQNILIGSILGDGNLALYGRSKNAYYREHGSFYQLPYRMWKCNKLKNLKFKIRENEKYPSLVSPSHPIFTKLYNKFYINNRKSLTKENIKMLNHPIGLACLYMDDGSLVIDSSKKSNKIYLFPRIAIYTLNFTKEENMLLIDHIKNIFNIKFKLKESPYGTKYLLELNKRNEVMKFINIVKPYVENIKCMKYKIEVAERMNNKYNALLKENIEEKIVISPLYVKNKNYTKEEENLIISLKLKGVKDKEIAKILDKTYYGVVDKIRRLRKEGKLE